MLQSGVCASRCGVVEHRTQAIPLTFYERKAA
jgi:bacterioferritin-associated ferredoxin